MKGILVSTHDQIYPTHTANDHPHQVRAFQAHAGVFAATMVLILAVNLSVNLSAGIAGQWSAWWSRVRVYFGLNSPLRHTCWYTGACDLQSGGSDVRNFGMSRWACRARQMSMRSSSAT